MDYLDPLKKRRKKTRLMIMYVLIGIAIAIATVVFVYLINGYSIDRQTGEVIQNGLVYIDSKPESAEVYLNGQKQRGRTDARLVLPAGSYDIELKRDRYRTWSRNLELEGGSLRRLTYARMVPAVLNSELAINFPTSPTMISQSIDRRWLVTAFIDNPLLMRVVDLSKSQFDFINLPLPLGLLDTKEAGTWEVIDWADDNKTFLAVYRTASSSEFVLVDREDGTKSKKLKTLFPSVQFSEVSLRSRKNDLLYLFDGTNKTLYQADTRDGSFSIVLQDVTSYKTFGDDTILYVTNKRTEVGTVDVYLKNGNESYKIRNIKESPNYLLDLSKLGSAIVLGICSPSENRAIIYNDPINSLKQNDFSTIPVPTTVLRVDNPTELEISTDSSMIIARSSQAFASHEFDADRSYSFRLDTPADEGTKLNWIDGQHLVVSVGGKQLMIDFDGSNRYELVASVGAIGSFFNTSTDFLYTVSPGTTAVEPYQLIRTFMRTAEDR